MKVIDVVTCLQNGIDSGWWSEDDFVAVATRRGAETFPLLRTIVERRLTLRHDDDEENVVVFSALRDDEIAGREFSFPKDKRLSENILS